MSAQKILKALILGAPASGKGTISSRIVKRYNIEHVSSGDKLRDHIQKQTDLGKEVKSYLSQGKLVPDDVMIKFMVTELKKIQIKSWLLDGFPRTVAQAQAIWKVEPVDIVLNLDVPFDVIIDRVKNRWVHLPSGRVYNIGFNTPKVMGKDDVTGEDLMQRPDDDIKDPELLKGLEQFLLEEMAEEERRNFIDNTIRIMVNRALSLKKWRPPKGLIFSLQQQSNLHSVCNACKLCFVFLSSNESCLE